MRVSHECKEYGQQTIEKDELIRLRKSVVYQVIEMIYKMPTVSLQMLATLTLILAASTPSLTALSTVIRFEVLLSET